MQRSIYNIEVNGDPSNQHLINLNKKLCLYVSYKKIEDSATFYSLPIKIEDTIALHLYNHIIHKSPRLKRIVIDFSYVERLGDGASIGHSRTEEYAVHGKRLIKLKHDTE